MMLEISDKCAAETGVDKSLVEDAINGQYSNDPKFGDYAVCFAKAFNFLNDAGDLQMDIIKDVIYAHYDKDKADAIMSKCMEKKASPQQTAVEMGKCMSAYRD